MAIFISNKISKLAPKPQNRVRSPSNPDMYLRSYAKLYKNKGAMTPGITEETVDGMSMAKMAKIIEAIRQEKWHWTQGDRILCCSGEHCQQVVFVEPTQKSFLP